VKIESISSFGEMGLVRPVISKIGRVTAHKINEIIFFKKSVSLNQDAWRVFSLGYEKG